MKNFEKNLHSERRKALAVLFAQLLLLFGFTSCLAVNASKFTTLGVVLMSLMIAIIFGLSFIGFHTIFYLDQEKMKFYKIINIVVFVVFIILHIIQQCCMKDDDYLSEYPDSYGPQLAASSVLVGVLVIFDVILMYLLKNLSMKWRKASERSQIKSGNVNINFIFLILKAVSDRMSYENILQTSLLLEDGGKNAKKIKG